MFVKKFQIINHKINKKIKIIYQILIYSKIVRFKLRNLFLTSVRIKETNCFILPLLTIQLINNKFISIKRHESN